MSKLIPQVVPLDAGTLTTAVNVNLVASYVDADTRDQVRFKWGIYSRLIGSSITQQNPESTALVPPERICNGSATVWFSVRDAIGNLSYSTTISIPIGTTPQQLLASPKVAPVDPDDSTQGMLVSIADDPVFDLTLQPGDQWIVTWDIYKQDGTFLNNFSKTLSLPPPKDGMHTMQVVPAPTGLQYTNVQYTVTRTLPPDQAADGTLGPISAQTFASSTVKITAQQLFPTGAEHLIAPVFTQAVAGILYMDTLEGDIQLLIPPTPDIANAYIDFIGVGKDVFAQPIAAAAWTAAPAFVASTPYSGTPLPRKYVDQVPNGGSYTVHYLKDAYTSFATTVGIERGQASPPTASTGELWGWGDPQYGTLG
jgi:hypothetical protein